MCFEWGISSQGYLSFVNKVESQREILNFAYYDPLGFEPLRVMHSIAFESEMINDVNMTKQTVYNVQTSFTYVHKMLLFHCKNAHSMIYVVTVT